MNKDTFLWLSIGFGVGMLISSMLTYHSFMEEKKRRDDPRLKRAEDLLDEAEALLKSARKKKFIPKPVV